MTLGVGHWYALPTPPDDSPRLTAALAALDAERPAGERGWTALHFLYAECRCSRRVLDHLLARGPLQGVREEVVLVGTLPDFERSAAAIGLAVSPIAPEDLDDRYGVTTAPLLVVGGPDGRARYVGGYTERKQGYQIRDVEIIEALQGTRVASWGRRLPAFGCAVSQSLQELLDPLGVKYRQ